MDEFKFKIGKVLKGDLDTTSTKVLISPDEIDSFLESEGVTQEDFDCNGWDWDFWVTYKDKQNNKFTLSGSGWYNRGLSFSKKDE